MWKWALFWCLALAGTAFAETHPYQDQLRCDQAQGNTLRGDMFDISNGQNRKIGSFSSGHVGACELALRASRGGVVCMHKNWQYEAIEISTGQTVQRFGSDLEECSS